MNSKCNKNNLQFIFNILIGIYVFVIILSGAAFQDNASENIDARALNILDANGKVRATIGVDDDGTTSLRFSDESGMVRSAIKTDKNSASTILFADSRGTPRLKAMCPEDGSAAISFYEASPFASVSLVVCHG